MKRMTDEPREPVMYCSGFGIGLGIQLDKQFEDEAGGPTPEATQQVGAVLGEAILGAVELGGAEEQEE